MNKKNKQSIFPIQSVKVIVAILCVIGAFYSSFVGMVISTNPKEIAGCKLLFGVCVIVLYFISKLKSVNES